jgi:hypothetical protein
LTLHSLVYATADALEAAEARRITHWVFSFALVRAQYGPTMAAHTALIFYFSRHSGGFSFR